MEQEYGICRLSVVPVRQTKSEKAEIVTQLLFGEHYWVTGKRAGWIRIKNYFDGYEGWISANQHHPISLEYFEQINNSDCRISLDPSALILYKKQRLTILMGSVFPVTSNEMFRMEEQLAFDGESKTLSQKWPYEQLKGVALKYLGAPYLWGGKTPFGIDCSGFTQMVYKICGYKLKRDASEQSNQGIVIDNLDNAMPGDLIFCNNIVSGTRHVGILLDEGKAIHASGKVRIDPVGEEGIINEESNRLTHALTAIRRILKT